MSVREGKVGQVGTARLRHTQRVEGKQAGQHVIVATGQPRLDQERSELGAIEPGAGWTPATPGAAGRARPENAR